MHLYPDIYRLIVGFSKKYGLELIAMNFLSIVMYSQFGGNQEH